MFDEKSHSLKMDKSIEAFSKNGLNSLTPNNDSQEAIGVDILSQIEANATGS